MNLDSGFIVLLLGQPYITRFPCNIYGILEMFQNTVSHIQGDSYSGLTVSKGQMESTITSENEKDWECKDDKDI